MKDNGVGLVIYVAIENTIHVPAYSCFNNRKYFLGSIMKLGVIYEEALVYVKQRRVFPFSSTPAL